MIFLIPNTESRSLPGLARQAETGQHMYLLIVNPPSITYIATPFLSPANAFAPQPKSL
jgi:hypothetical protein